MDFKHAKKKYNNIEKGALIRGIHFNIKFEEYLRFYNKPCYYCEIEAIGLDRIDSLLPYEASNVVPCCTTCNMMKGTLELNAFITHCKRIAVKFQNVQEVEIRPEMNLHKTIEEKEREQIIQSLIANKGNRALTSRDLGVSTTTLWRKMGRYGIEPKIIAD
ncbi:MAG: hypothetical protein FJ264_17520 [Planctomycetes bacterium]|nr:hypothetical protein [Planctomycetota bacterium]